MQFKQVKITNYSAFGKQVKSWAKGQDTLPKDLSELKHQLAAADVGVEVPDHIKRVKFVQADEDTWIIRLPAKNYLLAAEETLEHSDYSLPSFYEATFGSKPQVKDKLEFQAQRIADYTINGCR